MKVENLLFSLATLALLTPSAHSLERGQVSSIHRPHPTNKGCALLSEGPDVFIERLEEDDRGEIVGRDVFNDSAHETMTSPIGLGQTQNYHIHIKNSTQGTATFQVSLVGLLPPAKGKPDWPPTGWSASANYDDQTTDVLAQLKSAQGWETPRLEPGKETVIKLLLTAPNLATVAHTSFRVTARRGDRSDTVTGEVPIQAIAKLQWSVDQVHWTDVTPTTLIKVEQTDVFGLRAVKLHPDVDWPTSHPLGPDWTFHGDEFFGELVRLHAAELTDGDSEEAVAILGNTFPVKIKVVPGDAFITYDKDDEDNQH